MTPNSDIAYDPIFNPAATGESSNALSTMPQKLGDYHRSKFTQS